MAWSRARACWWLFIGLGARGGHADVTGLRHDLLVRETGPAEGIAHGPAEFREAVRLPWVKYGADVIKFCASGGVLSLADEVDTPQLTPEEMIALIDEAHRLRKKAAAHCHGDRAARDAILAGVDSIEHGSFLSAETLGLMRTRGTFLVPTLLAGEWTGGRLEKFPPEIAAKARAALAARPPDVSHRGSTGGLNRLRHRLGCLPPRDQRQGVRSDDRVGHASHRCTQIRNLRRR